jgi:signal peptidase I
MKFKNLLNIGFYGMITLISIYIILSLFAPNKVMSIFGFKTHVIVSSSMEPDMKINDLVLVKRVKEEKLKIRDAITFEAYIPELDQKALVTHYIAKIETRYDGTKLYYTQGANKAPGDYDQWMNKAGESVDLTYRDITGKVVFIIPFIGYLVRILQNPVMLLLVGINIGVIYLLIKIIKSPSTNK